MAGALLALTPLGRHVVISRWTKRLMYSGMCCVFIAASVFYLATKQGGNSIGAGMLAFIFMMPGIAIMIAGLCLPFANMLKARLMRANQRENLCASTDES
ncbi:hypothetical protein KSF73_10720 [Burkholderiaceae bacterium DAT-1]|nr:hypothetical protein [Burkholderiaceae bacterium DAT-1]